MGLHVLAYMHWRPPGCVTVSCSGNCAWCISVRVCASCLTFVLVSFKKLQYTFFFVLLGGGCFFSYVLCCTNSLGLFLSYRKKIGVHLSVFASSCVYTRALN